MDTRLRTGFLVLLLAGSVVNLAAGARRPFVEHRLLNQGHYPAADAAAAAVQRLVPPTAPVALVTWDADMLEELDCAVWADYRFKSLLYPRRFDVYRVTSAGSIVPAPGYDPTSARPSLPDYRSHPYLLYFRVTQPPLPPNSSREGLLASGDMWVLTRSRAAASPRLSLASSVGTSDGNGLAPEVIPLRRTSPPQSQTSNRWRTGNPPALRNGEGSYGGPALLRFERLDSSPFRFGRGLGGRPARSTYHRLPTTTVRTASR